MWPHTVTKDVKDLNRNMVTENDARDH
jgi:hypothetical protein